MRCAFTILLDEVAALSRRHQGDFVRSAVLLALTQATRSGDPVAEATLSPVEDRPVRAISVRAIAQSLGLPYETTRRKVAELEVLGLCRRLGRLGVQASQEALDGEWALAARTATWASLRRGVTDLRALGFDFGLVNHVSPQGGGSGRDLLASVAALSDDFILRLIEAGAAPHGSITNGAIATAMLMINAEPLTRNPALAWRYAGAETPPPDAMRRPASITQIAARLALSHETVRRRVQGLVEDGWAVRTTGGYLYPAERMQSPQMMQVGLVTTQRFLQLLQALRQLGVDLETVNAD